MNALLKFVLRGSAIGALALVATAAGCSSDSDSKDEPGAGGESTNGGSSNNAGKTSTEAGDSGVAGDKTGGGANNGGTDAGGTDAGGTDAGGTDAGGVGQGGDGAAGGPDIGLGNGGDFGGGGDTGTGTGPSVAKFCNTLSFGDNDTTMILEIGTGADKVTFTATTGECVPADGVECKEIPQGSDVPIVMFDADDPQNSLDDKLADVGAGEDWVFWTNLGGTESDPYPIIEGTTLGQSTACEEITYDDIP